MDRLIRIVLLIDDEQSSLVSRVHRVLEMASEAASTFEVILLASDESVHALELAEELALQYPQVRVSRQAAGEASVASSQADCWTYVQDSTKGFDASQVRRLCQLAATGRRQLEESSEAELAAASQPHAVAAQGLRMNELRQRPTSARETKLRVDPPESTDRIPLPFGTRMRHTRRTTRGSRPLAFAALRHSR